MKSLHLPFGMGRVLWTPDNGSAEIFANQVFSSRLVIEHYDGDGKLKNIIDTGSGLVTTAGTTLLAADWTNATATLKLANFHDLGTNATAETIADTVLGTPTGNARVAGTQSNPSAGQYRTTATLPFAGTFILREWGLFTASSGGTMLDHKTFAIVTVNNGDSFVPTYTFTCTPGG